MLHITASAFLEVVGLYSKLPLACVFVLDVIIVFVLIFFIVFLTFTDLKWMPPRKWKRQAAGHQWENLELNQRVAHGNDG